MANDTLTRDQAAELLEPISARIVGSIDRAWAKWLKHPDFGVISKRSRASIVSDYIATEIEAEFENEPLVTLAWAYGYLSMTVGNDLVIRFKKFRSKRLRTSGISTAARERFLSQHEVFDGMVITGAIAGYLLDDLEMRLEKIALTCPLETDNLWTLDLVGTADHATVTPVHAGPVVEDARTVVRKTSKKNNIKNATEG